MPNPILQDKYKGKSFGEISKDIESKYKDRFDPISRRGLIAEMTSLKEEQEFQKAKQQAREELQQMLAQRQQPQDPMQGMQDPMMQEQMMQQDLSMMQQPDMMASNDGVLPEMMQPDNMGHSASQSYNQQFDDGGTIDYLWGGDFDDSLLGDQNNPMSSRNFTEGIFTIDKTSPSINIPKQNNPLSVFRDFRYKFNTGNNTMNYLTSNLANLQKQTPVNTSLTPEQIESRRAFEESSNRGNATKKSNPLANRTDSFEPTMSRNNQVTGISNFANQVRPGLPQINIINDDLKTQLAGNIVPNSYKAMRATSQNSKVNPQDIDPMRYAPMAANLLGLLSLRKPKSVQSDLRKMGYKDRVDESLASRVNPRQTQFGNVDMSQIERGITDQARAFTGANTNMSGGQSGMFMANELANQSNVMNAIGNARMQAQGQDRQTQAMNAQEQARVDAMLQQQNMQRAGLQGQNVGIGMQLADLDARNRAGFDNARFGQLSGLAQNLGNLGRESDQMSMIANALGYNSFGEYVQSLPLDQRANATQALMQSLGNILGTRK